MDSIEACVNELKSFELFSEFSKSELEALCIGGRPVFCNHRDALFKEGEPAHFFGVALSGAFKLTKATPVGEDVIVHFAIPGDVIAAFIMPANKATYPISASALGPSRFLKIPKENFLTHWKQNPNLLLKIQSSLSARMHQLQNDKMMIKAPLNQRLASLLLNLLDKSSHQSEGLLPVVLTRKELADSLGASVESVIRIMSEWSKLKVIETNEQQIRVLKVDHLIQQLDVN